MKELPHTAIIKPPEVIENTFFGLFLSLCFHALKNIRLESLPRYYLNDLNVKYVSALNEIHSAYLIKFMWITGNKRLYDAFSDFNFV